MWTEQAIGLSLELLEIWTEEAVQTKIEVKWHRILTRNTGGTVVTLWARGNQMH